MTAVARVAKRAQHSAASAEWYTPPEYIEAARRVLNGIDLDPASCAEANATVQADHYYSAGSDTFTRLWAGSVLLNPPGGLVREFWQHLVAEWTIGRVTEAIWIGYSLEQLQMLQRFDVTPLDFPMCVPRRRIAFVSPGSSKRSPAHGNYITYLPTREPRGLKAFAAEFAAFGRVRL